MTGEYEYDLFTIGAGSGGVRASRMSAARGARVAVAEERFLGGTCVNVGCVPKKLMVYASHFAEEIEDMRGYGWQVEGARFDWSRLIANKNQEIERLNGIYRRLLDNAGVDLFEGRAVLTGPHSVRVGEREITTRNILVATGGRPTAPVIPGAEFAISSDQAFFLERLPEHVVMVGGGYIAVEFAGIFRGLGSQVSQLYRGPLFLRGFDEDVRIALAEEMRLKGIDLRFDLNIVAIEKLGDGRLRCELTDGEVLETNQVFYAIGREPNTVGLGLEKAGVETDVRGAIPVDPYLRTNVESVWALGDVTTRNHDLTPVAIHEGMCLTETLFGDRPRSPDYDNIPTAVFSQPPIGTVGLTEAEARERHGELDIYRSRFRVLKHTMTENKERTLMKLIVVRATQRVVGAHMIGPDAGEILQGIGIAIKMGATKQQFDQTIGIHPTAAEEFVTMREPVS